MDNNVKHVDFKDEVNCKVMLRKLADDDKLKGCVMVCIWDDNSKMTTAWSSMPLATAALGTLVLQRSIIGRTEIDG